MKDADDHPWQKGFFVSDPYRTVTDAPGWLAKATDQTSEAG